MPKVNAVTPADLDQAARTRLHPDRLITVVVGDPKWRDDLAELGPVETVTPEF